MSSSHLLHGYSEYNNYFIYDKNKNPNSADYNSEKDSKKAVKLW